MARTLCQAEKRYAYPGSPVKTYESESSRTWHVVSHNRNISRALKVKLEINTASTTAGQTQLQMRLDLSEQPPYNTERPQGRNWQVRDEESSRPSLWQARTVDVWILG